MTLHYCDFCPERSEAWKRTASGKHFFYCINRSCPKYSLDKNQTGGIIGNTTPQNGRKSEGTQMTYTEAKTLIDAAKQLGYRGTDWEQGFLQRLDAMQPAFLLPEDAKSVEEFYRRATGGGFKVGRDHGVVHSEGSDW